MRCDAYYLGGQARESTLPIQANPYPLDSNDYIDWEKGWVGHDPFIASINKRVNKKEKQTAWITSTQTSSKSELYDRYK